MASIWDYITLVEKEDGRKVLRLTKMAMDGEGCCVFLLDRETPQLIEEDGLQFVNGRRDNCEEIPLSETFSMKIRVYDYNRPHDQNDLLLDNSPIAEKVVTVRVTFEIIEGGPSK